MYAHSTDPATSIALGNEVIQDSGGSRSRAADAAVTIAREHNLSESTASAIGLCALDAKFGLQSSSSTDNSQTSSSNDDKFMNMLRSVGITPTTGAGNWIAVGHSMCDELSAGRASPWVATDAANGGLPQIQANDIVNAAIQFYCPQFKNEYVQPTTELQSSLHRDECPRRPSKKRPVAVTPPRFALGVENCRFHDRYRTFAPTTKRSAV
jgi:hypothetical protein